MQQKKVLILVVLIAFATAIKLAGKHKLKHLNGELDLNSLRDAQLQKHNQLRAKHGCPPLALDDELNRDAQKFSKFMLAYKFYGHLNQTQSVRYGRNVYWGWNSPTYEYVPGTASLEWYDQINDYNFDTFKSNNPSRTVSHFTAMIWKYAKKVGFGYAYGEQDDGYAIYVTANYYPYTNINGRYAQNVPRPIY